MQILAQRLHFTVSVRNQLYAGGAPLIMNRTVGEHIQTLEEQRDRVSGHLMREQDKVKRNQLESELRAIESALTHYRKALELESKVLPR